MKRNIKRIRLVAAIFLLLVAFVLPASAEAQEEIDAASTEIWEEWGEFRSAIPDEVADLLPEDFFSEEMEKVGQSVREMATPTSIFRTVLRLFGLTLAENLALLARICGVLVLSATLRAVVGEGKSGASHAASLIAVLSIVLMLFSGEETKFSQMERFLDTVRGLCVALVPLMGVLYAMGGNVAAAVANHGVMSGFLAILETVCSGVAIPLACVLVALALLDAVTGKGTARPISALIKRTFTLGLSFCMMLLVFALSLQHTLAKGSDTLALRTVRFAAGSFLPVVGGSISEALRTVSGSVEYLRGTVGVGGILVVFFLFLPPFISALLTRLALSVSSALAGLFSCTREERLLSEFASVWGYFLAIMACLFVMTVFSLTLLARTSAAIGG